MNCKAPVLTEPEIVAQPRNGAEFLFSEQLPVGITLTCLKESAGLLDITIPSFEAEGLTLTFMNCKGDLQISLGRGRESLQETSPGLGLLTSGRESLHFKSFSPASLSAVMLFIGKDWINSFMKDNAPFQKIVQALGEEEHAV